MKFLCSFSLQNLTIEETSPGVDGQQYTLRFIADIPDIEIPSFDLPFLFYNGLLSCFWHQSGGILFRYEFVACQEGGGHDFMLLAMDSEPPRALATSTIMWVRSYFHPFWAVVNKSNAG